MELARSDVTRLSFPLIGVARWATFGLAACVSVGVWTQTGAKVPAGWLAPALVGALMLSNYVSLPVGGKARIWFFNIPAFLIVALFAPPVAMMLVGIGMGAKEVLTCRRCQNSADVVAAQTGRWMFLALGGALIAQSGDVLITGLLLCVLLWLGDVLTAPLVVSFGSVSATIKRLLARTWEDELMQYMTAYFMVPFFLTQYNQGLLIGLSLILNVTWLGLYITFRRAATAIT